MKRIFSIALIIVFLFCFTGCKEKDVLKIKIGVLAGPTGMGMAKLMKDAETGESNYSFELFSAPTDVTGLLVNKELDIAALPTNLASALYNKTNGEVILLAVNTLGVLYVLEKGDTVHSVNDLEGKKIYSSGQSSVPQYALDYVLKQSNISCEVEYFATHQELATQALSGNADIILLPEPMVSTVLAKNSDFRIALDFNSVWEDACDRKALLAMGCLAVRKEFYESNRSAVEGFLKEYKASVEFVNNNSEQAAEYIAELKIVPAAAIALKAIPNSKIVFINGDEMKAKVNEFLQILYESDKTSIGGNIPKDDFYC